MEASLPSLPFVVREGSSEEEAVVKTQIKCWREPCRVLGEEHFKAEARVVLIFLSQEQVWGVGEKPGRSQCLEWRKQGTVWWKHESEK